MAIEKFKTTTRQKVKPATHHKESMNSEQNTTQSEFMTVFGGSNLWSFTDFIFLVLWLFSCFLKLFACQYPSTFSVFRRIFDQVECFYGTQ
jgi:uncharacterized membrane protein